MKGILVTTMVVISTLGWSAAMVRSNSLKVLAEFPGSSLKWIRVAEPEFEREKLDLNKYTISVVDEGDSVAVMLRAADIPKGARGNTAGYPGYEVEISKKDLKVLQSNYTR